MTDPRVPDDGKPSTIGMGADGTSTVEADFNATGGVIRFADLVPLAGIDYTGEAMDLSGTIEFICDVPLSSGQRGGSTPAGDRVGRGWIVAAMPTMPVSSCWMTWTRRSGRRPGLTSPPARPTRR